MEKDGSVLVQCVYRKAYWHGVGTIKHRAYWLGGGCFINKVRASLTPDATRQLNKFQITYLNTNRLIRRYLETFYVK